MVWRIYFQITTYHLYVYLEILECRTQTTQVLEAVEFVRRGEVFGGIPSSGQRNIQLILNWYGGKSLVNILICFLLDLHDNRQQLHFAAMWVNEGHSDPKKPQWLLGSKIFFCHLLSGWEGRTKVKEGTKRGKEGTKEGRNERRNEETKKGRNEGTKEVRREGKEGGREGGRTLYA